MKNRVSRKNFRLTVRVNIGSVSTFPKSVLRQGSRPSNIIDGHFPGVLRWFSLTLVLLRCSTLKQGQISSFNVMKFIFLKPFKWNFNISACVIDRKLKFWGKLRQRLICISWKFGLPIYCRSWDMIFLVRRSIKSVS